MSKEKILSKCKICDKKLTSLLGHYGTKKCEDCYHGRTPTKVKKNKGGDSGILY